jgi:hypothetical protein
MSLPPNISKNSVNIKGEREKEKEVWRKSKKGTL